MAEVILGSVVGSLAGHVHSLLSNEIGQTYSVKLQLNKLQSTLLIIRGLLQDAEKRQVNDQSLKIWLKKLQDLAYEADDLLDDFNTEAIRRRSVVGGYKKVVSEGIIIGDIEEAASTLEATAILWLTSLSLEDTEHLPLELS